MSRTWSSSSLFKESLIKLWSVYIRHLCMLSFFFTSGTFLLLFRHSHWRSTSLQATCWNRCWCVRTQTIPIYKPFRSSTETKACQTTSGITAILFALYSKLYMRRHACVVVLLMKGIYLALQIISYDCRGSKAFCINLVDLCNSDVCI